MRHGRGYLGQRLTSQWPFIAALLTLVAAALDPHPGASVYKSLSKALIVSLFGILGLNLDLQEFSTATMTGSALRFHCCFQIFSLILTPFLYYALVYRWRWEVGLLHHTFAVGVMVAMCMPTTTNTSVLFVQQAGGDVSVATINAALGNIIGAVVAPLLASLLLGPDVGSEKHASAGSYRKTVGKMASEILLPLCVGLVVQVIAQFVLLLFKGWSSERTQQQLEDPLLKEIRQATHADDQQPDPIETHIDVYRRMIRPVKLLNNLILVALFYLIFCKAFTGKHGTLEPRRLCILFLWITVVHLLLLALAWWLGQWAAPGAARRRVSFVLGTPQKTEGMALAILASLFEDSEVGVMSLPVVFYHSVQMVVAVLLIPKLIEYIEAHPEVGAEAGNAEDSHSRPQGPEDQDQDQDQDQDGDSK